MDVLVVEGEQRLCDFLLRAMRAEGWTATAASDGEAGLRLAEAGDYDVIVLDLMLPAPSGMDVCRALRAQGRLTPILMLSDFAEVSDRVAGLRQGVDDYLGKPFALDELLARVEALGRRRRPPAESPSNACGPLRFDPAALELTVDGTPVALTMRESGVIRLLMANPGRVVSRERILNGVWGVSEDPLTNIVDVYVARLRRKLGGRGASIETVRGAGYRLRVPAAGRDLRE